MIIDQVIATLRSHEMIDDCAADIPDLATAFDIQDAATREIAKDRGGFAGYKIAFNSSVLMEKLKIPHPGMGRIFADQVYQNGAKIDESSLVKLMIEPEIAAVLGKDISPGADISVANMVSYIDHFAPAFEILDRRSVEGLSHVPTIIAHNVFNAGIVLGAPGLPPNQLDAAKIYTDCRDNGKIVVQGQGIAPQNLSEALGFLAGHFTRRGQVLPAGSILLLGAHCPLYAVGKNREMTLDMGILGRVSFST